ncbi:MAG: site-2 protease family protein [Candidatus Marinimicrobia bacterium]|nr:site-2 protease family protein [Candidatus Neomarinimicrobiota bacterium]
MRKRWPPCIRAFRRTTLKKWSSCVTAREQNVTLTPVLQKTVEDGDLKEVGMMGVSPEVSMKKAGVFGSVGQGFKTTGYWLKMTLGSLKLLVTGQESFKNVGRRRSSSASLQENPRRPASFPFIGLIGILSVNLALLNILPIPGLDGGHIIIAGIEGIMGREMKIRTKMAIQQLGMFLLFGLLILAIVNDVFRLFQ